MLHHTKNCTQTSSNSNVSISKFYFKSHVLKSMVLIQVLKLSPIFSQQKNANCQTSASKLIISATHAHLVSA